MRMNIDNLIIMLGIAIVCCLAILVYFVISDKAKAAKNAVLEESFVTKDTAKEVAAADASTQKDSTTGSGDASKEPTVVCTEESTEELTTSSEQPQEGLSKSTAVMGEEKSAEENGAVTAEPLAQEPAEENSDVSTADAPTETNRGSKKKATIGFLNNEVTSDTVMALLHCISEELTKRSANTGKTYVNYLEDDALDLIFDNGCFLLNNEEIMRNGFIQGGNACEVYAGDRIVIRFCVNFAVPEGYKVHVLSDLNALRNKGLSVKEIVCPDASSLSIRAILQAGKACKISKTDKLFKVQILQSEEVRQ